VKAARVSRIAYRAPILGGYDSWADVKPSDGKWRVLAIHGTPCRPYMFSRFLAAAPDDVEVVVPFRAGYGGANYGPDVRKPVLSFDDQVQSFRPLIEYGDKRTIALGVSYGGALALKTALDMPDLISGVVTSAALVTEPRAYVLATLPLGEAPGLKQLLPGYLRNARAEITGRRTQIGGVFSRLKDYRLPVSILHGDADHLVSLSDATTLRAYFARDADVELEVVRGGSHFLELLHPRRLWQAVQSVIARANAKSARNL
jgi:pimeloyl-ACP methyl ester carboxylesterase